MSHRVETLASGRHRALPAPAAEPAAAAHRRRVLVAEDNLINQQVINAQLKLLGLSTAVANNGIEALACWREGGFALLLTDLQMPLMDGYELAANVRREEVAPVRIPILALTANAKSDESNRCRMAGMDAYLTKPISLPALEAALGRWIELPRDAATASMASVAAVASAASAAPASPAFRAPQRVREPVEPGALAAVLGDNDPAILRGFFVEFAASSLQAAADLQAAVDRRLPRAAGPVAHHIKASARTIGAMRLGNLCSHIENAAEASDLDSLAAGVALFHAEVQLVRRWIDARHGSQPRLA